jgi:hypothetical protein
MGSCPLFISSTEDNFYSIQESDTGLGASYAGDQRPYQGDFMKPFLVFLTLLALILLPGCGLNRTEYDRMRDIRTEYLAQLGEIRQANEIISRNIMTAYKEIEVLQARLNQQNQTD